MDGKFVAYYRVSTDHHGLNGNGIAAQQKVVADYLNGGRWKLVAEATEVESGKKADRPELGKALAACKRHKARLVIAKLDRLSRNVHFISGLMERKVDFVACDMPSANGFMINIYAAVAQEGRRMISERTRAGLAAARDCTAGDQRDAPASRCRARAGHQIGTRRNSQSLDARGRSRVEPPRRSDSERQAVVADGGAARSQAIGELRARADLSACGGLNG
jgi:hypothetical protein